MIVQTNFNQRINDIVSGLAGLSMLEASQVLAKAMHRVLATDEPETEMQVPVVPMVNLQRRRLSKIEADPEVKLFIYSLKGYQTLKAIAEVCREQFGEERAPSRSSIHRHIQRLKYPNGPLNSDAPFHRGD